MATAMAQSIFVCSRNLFFQAPQSAVSRYRPRTSLHHRRFQAGRAYAAVVSREDKNILLMGVDPDNLETVTHVLEQARRAADRWVVAHSDFLPPPTLSDTLLALKRTADIGIVVSGGYAEAERCRISVGNAEAMTTSAREEIESSSVAAGEEGAQVLVAPEMVGFLCATVTQVRGVHVETSPIPLSDLAVKVLRMDVSKTVEASLRVDAIASAGFRMSRTKLSDLISGGALSVNWKVVTKSGAILKSGDVVSLRGKGRIEVGQINVTKKGRYAVELFRYL